MKEHFLRQSGLSQRDSFGGTTNPQLRRLMLYPIELLAHFQTLSRLLLL